MALKRSRDSTSSSSFTPRKRRIACASYNDENIDPKSVQDEEVDVINKRQIVLEDLEDPFGASRCETIAITKSATGRERIALSTPGLNRKSRKGRLIERSTTNSQLLTPTTPRHHDALAKKIPVTPRHKILASGTPLTPKTPRTPSTPSNAPTLYNSAKQLFVRSSNPGRLVGREEERATLDSFLESAIATKSGRCMYISGPPGTGKSALVSEVCKELEGRDDVRTAYINCMSFKSSKDIYSKLIEDLCDDLDTESNEATTLKDLFFPRRNVASQTYVVTLDEIDHLLTLDLEVLYTLFEWSLSPSSRLVLVGIANALDLTDRFLPRLKARNLKPQLLPFLPYTVAQITSVITTKLKSLLPPDGTANDFIPFLHPTAIQFCSKKVASQTGDLRKAFDIVRRSLDLIENETKKKQQEMASSSPVSSPSRNPLVENINLSSPSSPARSFKKPQVPSVNVLAHLTSETAPRATIAHMAKVTASAFNNGTAQRLKSLNLQQKAALCALVALEKKTAQLKLNVLATPSKSANAVPTIRKVYEMYCGLCRRENALHPLTATEFADVVGGLETLSLVQAGDGKGAICLGFGRMTSSKKLARPEERRIGSCVSEREIEGCLDGPGGGILRGLLKGED